MSNSFYNHGSTPVFRSQGLSSLIRAEFDAITAGFNKLPALSAGVARRLVAVNAAGDALETIFSGYHGAGNPTVLTTNTALGVATLAVNTTGPSNTAIGYQCLTANTTGSSNTAVGTSALAANTTGSSNTAVGVSALPVITTGSNNVGCGNSTLYRLVTGSQNAALGVSALSSVTGNDNVGVGYIAGYRITTGQYNTVVGSQAVAAANVTADGMTAVGYSALATNVSGAGNTAVGYQALGSLTGDFNTAVGYGALATNVSGTSNTAVGYRALTAATGGFNTAVGYNALVGNTSGIVNTAVGHFALGACTTGGSNAALGQGALADLTTGSDNTAIGTGSGLNVVATDRTTSIGKGARANAPGLTNFTALGYNAVATASNQMMFGDTNVTQNYFHAQVRVAGGTVSSPVDIDTTYAGTAAINLRNLDNGASSQTMVYLRNDGTSVGSLCVNSSTFTPTGVYAADAVMLTASIGDLNFSTNTGGKNMNFAVGGTTAIHQMTATAIKVAINAAPPAGGTAGTGLLFSSTTNLGVFFGSGAPTLSAAKGSLYLRTDGTTTNNRIYVNTDGGTTWTAMTTVA